MNHPNFFSRYWHILLVVAILILAVLNNAIFRWLGAMAYLPLLCAGVVLLTLAVRNALHRKTTEPYIRSGEYDHDFEHLPKREKVWVTVVQYIAYLWAFAHIAAALMR